MDYLCNMMKGEQRMSTEKINEQSALQGEIQDEDADYNENESWRYVKVYDPSIATDRTYKPAKLNRFYHRRNDNKVYIDYEEKPSRYSQGNF